MEIRDCADCRPRNADVPGLIPPDPSLFGPWFEAAHYGYCPGCGGEIMPNDTIRSDGRGGWICEGCGLAELPDQPGPGHTLTLLEQFAAGHIDLGRGTRLWTWPR
jgi:hypothetical protein